MFNGNSIKQSNLIVLVASVKYGETLNVMFDGNYVIYVVHYSITRRKNGFTLNLHSAKMLQIYIYSRANLKQTW